MKSSNVIVSNIYRDMLNNPLGTKVAFRGLHESVSRPDSLEDVSRAEELLSVKTGTAPRENA
jgi:hypothetical protein